MQNAAMHLALCGRTMKYCQESQAMRASHKDMFISLALVDVIDDDLTSEDDHGRGHGVP
jgi:hypothetical protein